MEVGGRGWATESRSCRGSPGIITDTTLTWYLQGWTCPGKDRDILARSEDTNPEKKEARNERTRNEWKRRPHKSRINATKTKQTGHERTRHEQNTERMDTNHRKHGTNHPWNVGECYTYGRYLGGRGAEARSRGGAETAPPRCRP